MENLSQYFDHTLLRADATKTEVSNHCQQARRLGVKAVCVLPTWIPLCRENLTNTGIEICTVIGFPHGGDSTLSKAAGLDWAKNNGATELDISLNLGWLKSGNYKYVGDEIHELVALAEGTTTKIIVESGLLTIDELKRCTALVANSGATFIKTSSGFASPGATPAAVKIIRQSLDNSGLKIKASGGIQSADQVSEYLGLGVERFGTSQTEEILRAFKQPVG